VILALLAAMRPRQWTKNLLVFAGVLFSRHLGDPAMVLRAAFGFVAFCLISSFGYVLNDLHDAESDRQHPTKRLRPIPSGRLPRSAAFASLLPLAVGGALITATLGRDFAWAILLYLAINFAYTQLLKRIVLLDVFAIASGFVVRAIAGVALMLPVAPDTQLSPWLLVCTFFGALFLALAKRRRELANAGDHAPRQREVLGSYTPELLEGLLLVTASSAMISYALYTIWPATVEKFGTDALMFTIPFVTYGIFRYLYLVRSTEYGEDPATVLLRDLPIACCVLLYVGTVLAILYWPR
jgi:4-hydroxybenzoate polyprenyltransferase